MATFTGDQNAPSAVPSFSIREVNGRRRTVILKERALPYRPFTLEGTQQVDITYYPGNPVATSNILGAREGTTSINGYWKQRFLTDSVTTNVPTGTQSALSNRGGIQTVEQLVDLVDSFRRAGALIEVIWGTRIRRGHITKFTQQWHNTNDCEWTIEFQWVSRGQPAVTPTVSDGDTSAVATRLHSNWYDLEQAATDIPTTPRGSWYDRVLDGISDIGAISTTVQDMAAQMWNNVNQPFDVTRATISNLTGAVSTATTIVETLMQTPVEQLFNYGQVGVPSFASALVGATYMFKAKRATQKLLRQAIIDRDTLLKLVANDVEQIYTTRSGDDLVKVSQLFFNDPGQWRQIMLFNGLRSSELSVGQVLLIPKLTQEGA